MAAFPGIDISKAGKYPIVLSDALLGKTTKEVYTSVRYNHKPDPSGSSPSSMHLEPSASDPTLYDLSYKDKSDKFAYQGVRASGDGKYVLIFDPIKEHFVLHRVDSTFDMNLVSAPWDQEGSSLRKQYTQIGNPKTNSVTAAPAPKRKPAKANRPAAAAKSDPPKRKKAEKVTKPKPPPRAPTPKEEDEEDSDDGFEVEYPDGPPSQKPQYQPTPQFQRQDSEDASEEDSDAPGEEYEDERDQDVDQLKLPSPANNTGVLSEEEEMDLDLEAELEQALMNEGNESSESEEE